MAHALNLVDMTGFLTLNNANFNDKYFGSRSRAMSFLPDSFVSCKNTSNELNLIKIGKKHVITYHKHEQTGCSRAAYIDWQTVNQWLINIGQCLTNRHGSTNHLFCLV
ncbi:uncharacterized protein LOC105431517 [Pogonomyrmex barbatus]|uniref:Uncharacterized protein LOC105431517 n=1 Tax=Pogonomyrmex barbatus TaxID=144034 RepID=A0A6I9WVY9_9HYME|nr:uncharacterized protein LOC105431517 [Pogonomyrmex barbatus]